MSEVKKKDNFSLFASSLPGRQAIPQIGWNRVDGHTLAGGEDGKAIELSKTLY